ncbi:MAG TPA: DUF3025 domain-containing protein [Polyangiaceae bacterium]|nr:DUF3025 domain-containing protein [Polyangiaceae bacterium]
MRPLVVVRRAVAFDPRFCARSPHFWPLRRALGAIGPGEDFPTVGDFARVFAGDPPVRFVPASPPRRRTPLDPRALYDARITLDGVVPTRERCWHDFMNALVWGTFPRAKRALHARQHRAIAARIAPGARTLPPARTRELDALALLDEGGVVLLARDPAGLRAALMAGDPGALEAAVGAGDARGIVFGHAIYESLALGVAPAIVAAVVVDDADDARRACGEADRIAHADRVLEALLEDSARLMTPEELKRVDLNSTAPRTWATDAPSDESVRPMAS